MLSENRKRWRLLVVFLFISVYLLTGCFLDIKRFAETARDSRELLPVRSFKIVIDSSQREQLFEQVQEFAEIHSFYIEISDYGTNFGSYLIWMLRDNIEVIVGHSSYDPEIVSVGFYDESRAISIPDETMDSINELAYDLERLVMEIPDATITDRR